jgi:hypothetical protein
MITIEAKKVATRVIATVKVGIGTGQYTYTVQFADQGSEAANEAEAKRELRKTLEEVLEALGPSWEGGLFPFDTDVMATDPREQRTWLGVDW